MEEIIKSYRLIKRSFFVIPLIICMLFQTSCTKKIEQGEIYDKEFKAKHTQTTFIPITSGESTILMPYYNHYPDQWILHIQDYDSEKEKFVTESYYVSEDVFDSVSIGDWISFKDVDGSTFEPSTREQKTTR